MKPATPILRNEHYLDVMTGGSASLPSPILREERYLAKLAGMDVSIPSPVTIKEFYYAKICGMDVDVPTYTRNMPRIYAYMAKAAGQTIEELPTAVTREQRYWYDYVSEPPVTEHEYTGAVPYSFNANGEPLIDWYIKGNTVQSTTPTPDNPIMPQGCGERTGNLFNITRTQSNTFTLDTSKWFVGAATTSAASTNASCTVSDGKITVESFAGGHGACFMIPVTEQTDYVLTFDADKISSGSYVGYSYRDANGGILYISTISAKSVILTTYPNTAFIDICFRCPPADGKVEYSNIMLNLGSQPLPYEPFGVKIPISSAGQTTPVYLGEVPTTRKIKKLVLTGEETMTHDTIGGNSRFTIENTYTTVDYRLGICSHYNYAYANNNNTIYHTSTNSAKTLFILDNNYTTVSQYKSYLAAQYAAGTPVTVWYVLATEETAVVNEPLMKIGEYADEVSNVATIPTNNGSTTIDVDTTVKPSEIYIKYKGV